MGGVEVGSDLLDGAKRELKEETGLTALRWERILDTHISNSVTDVRGIVFTARDLTEGEPEFGETEQLQIRKLPFGDALQMVHDGLITDVLSVAGILRLACKKSR